MSPSQPRLAAIPAALLLVVMLAAPALAHADLVASDPADGAVLATPPTSITLEFSEGLDQGKSSFKLSGPGGAAGTGQPTKDGGTVMTLDELVLGPGAYTVKWTAASTDGHVERGRTSFTVLEPTPVPATPSPVTTATPATSSVPATAATATPGLTATPTPTTSPTALAPSDPPAPSGDDAAPAASSATDVLLPIVVGLVLVAAVGAFVLRRSRRV